MHAAKQQGLRSKRHVFASGRTQGGNPFSRGQIYHLLTNPVYCGLIRHKTQVFEGQHKAIIAQDLWDSVQKRLKSASARRRGAPAGQGGDAQAPLKGKVRDETGDILTPSHTSRHGKRHHYYISNRLVTGGPDPSGWRLPARPFEDAVAQAIADNFRDHAERHTVLKDGDLVGAQTATGAILKLVSRLEAKENNLASSLVSAITLGRTQLSITLDAATVACAAGLDASLLQASLCQLTTMFAQKRRGVELRIVAGTHNPAPDQTLIRALRNAHDWAGKLKAGKPLREIADHAGYTDRYIRRIISLISLSPRIQTAILDGTQPTELNLETLVRGNVPLDWNHQDRLFEMTD